MHTLVPSWTDPTLYHSTPKVLLLPDFLKQPLHLKAINSSDTCASKHLWAVSTGGLC